jgi:hypothetical protein
MLDVGVLMTTDMDYLRFPQWEVLHPAIETGIGWQIHRLASPKNGSFLEHQDLEKWTPDGRIATKAVVLPLLERKNGARSRSIWFLARPTVCGEWSDGVS